MRVRLEVGLVDEQMTSRHILAKSICLISRIRLMVLIYLNSCISRT